MGRPDSDGPFPLQYSDEEESYAVRDSLGGSDRVTLPRGGALQRAVWSAAGRLIASRRCSAITFKVSPSVCGTHGRANYFCRRNWSSTFRAARQILTADAETEENSGPHLRRPCGTICGCCAITARSVLILARVCAPSPGLLIPCAAGAFGGLSGLMGVSRVRLPSKSGT